MLLLQAFGLFQSRIRHEGLHEKIFAEDSSLETKVDLVSSRVLLSVLQSQYEDGSWGCICEVTAYAVLALASSSLLHSTQRSEQLSNALHESMSRGKAYLASHRNNWGKGHYIWVEKVTYSSNLLSETYCLAASIVPLPSSHGHSPVSQTPSGMACVEQGMRKAGQVLARTPLLSDLAPYALAAAEVQAVCALADLEKTRPTIFHEVGNLSGGDRYMMFIPLIWTVCAAKTRSSVSFSIIEQMIRLSILLFQVDEFMEAVIGIDFRTELSQVRALITRLVNNSTSYTNGRDHNGREHQPLSQDGRYASLRDVEFTLDQFIKHILHNTHVAGASSYLQGRLARELEIFLQAHIDQIEDSQEGIPSGRSLYQWVRSTSADHTSCPMSFVYYNCLVGSSLLETSSATSYVAEDLCRHLATMCRIYNDYGSIARDRKEGNLNCADFSEIKTNRDGGQRTALMWIAEYERRGLDSALKELEELGDIKSVGALKFFVNVTDLFGQLYVLQDLSNLVNT